jgi:uncharacterized RDD family membrane protein YckC
MVFFDRISGYPVFFFNGSYGSWLVDDGDLRPSFLRSSTLGIRGMGTLVLNQDVNRLSGQIQLANGKGSIEIVTAFNSQSQIFAVFKVRRNGQCLDTTVVFFERISQLMDGYNPTYIG